MRGQSTLDFAIGAAIFVAVLLFAFSFVPGILDPFDVRGQQEPPVSDRVANSLSADMLGSPEEPGILDRYCTVAFFNGSLDSDDCSFDNGEDVRERLNLSSFLHVNVTIVNSSAENEPYCWTSSSAPDEPRIAAESDCDPGDDSFEIGDSPASARTTITARRTVRIGEEIATLRVVIW